MIVFHLNIRYFIIVIFTSMIYVSSVRAQTILFEEDFETSPVTSIVNIRTGILPDGSSSCSEAARGDTSDFNSDFLFTIDFKGNQNPSHFLGQNPLADCGGFTENMYLSSGALDFSGDYDSITFKCRYYQTVIFGDGATAALELTVINGSSSQTYSIETFSTFENWETIEFRLPNEMISTSDTIKIYMSPADGSALDDIQVLGYKSPPVVVESTERYPVWGFGLMDENLHNGMAVDSSDVTFTYLEGGKQVFVTRNWDGEDVVVDKWNNNIMVYEYSGEYFDMETFESNNINNTNGIAIRKSNHLGNELWTKYINSTGNDFVNSVTSDEQGDIIITGGFAGSHIDTTDEAFIDLTTESDAFVLKLDANGNYIFDKQLVCTGNMQIRNVVTDESGNIIVCGYYGAICDFDPGTGEVNEATNGTSESFVLKLDPQGSYIWHYVMPSTGISKANDCTIDDEGSVFVTGNYNDTIKFKSDDSFNRVSEGSFDGFICKLNSSGVFQWARTYGNTDDDAITSVVFDGKDIILSGYFNNSLDVNPDGVSTVLTADVNINSFVQKLDTAGNQIWAVQTGTGGVEVHSIASNSNENILLCGKLNGTDEINIGGSLSTLVSNGNDDIFIAELDSNGTFTWGQNFGGNNTDFGFGITYTKRNNVLLCGSMDGEIDFDSRDTVDLIRYGEGSGFEAFLVKFGDDCKAELVQETITACDNYLSPSGNYEWTVSGIYYDTLTNVYGCDSIIEIDLTVNNSSSGDTTAITCESFEWYGSIYTESGTPTHTLTNSVGCDSVVSLNLTILEPSTGTDVISACESYTWIDGVTYTESNNTANFTLTNSVGCDSVVTLNLTILESSTGTDVVSACESYTWIDGVTYTESNNTANFTLTNSVGCDSVVTLKLTILEPSTGTDVISACDSYTWIDGVTYTESNNTVTFITTNSVGCDSVVTLNLTILESSTGTDVVSACESYTWIDGVTYTESNNTANFTLTNSIGCDSVVILNLTILEPSTGTDVVSACESYTWIDGVTYTESNNTANFTLTNSIGCDSVVTLNLTILEPSTGTDVVSACESYTWIDGVIYTESNNTATFTLTNSVGCDSVVTLNLTILKESSSSNLVTECVSYEWNGVTYTASGVYQAIFTNVAGCDSIAELNLTITDTCSTTDIGTLAARNIKVFPNPVSQKLTIKTPSNEYTNIAIIDMTGRIVMSKILEKGVTQMDVSELNKGTYIIKFYGIDLPLKSVLVIKE